MTKISEDFIFTFPFLEHNTNIKFYYELSNDINDDLLKSKILELKYKFITQKDCLCHGDLHTDSIMIDENKIYILDHEFSFYGPFGFDIGVLVAHLISSFVYHIKNEKYQDYLISTIQKIYEILENKIILNLKNSNNFINEKIHHKNI